MIDFFNKMLNWGFMNTPVILVLSIIVIVGIIGFIVSFIKYSKDHTPEKRAIYLRIMIACAICALICNLAIFIFGSTVISI